ncbi:MAG: ATP-binding cassette domain-containing protein [Desulfobacterales bacterium]|jgi:taurine transport system ATP-binding protein
MSVLELKSVSVIYPPATKAGEDVHALENITLNITGNDFVVALGASGCGKTTLLNVMAGFIQPSGGEVLLDSKPIKRPGADRGVVFQQHALLPWLNVMDNTSFGLMLQKKQSDERKEVAAKYLGLVGLEEFLNHFPYQLSGGMRQRVGLARALTSDPAILLMDEPLGALDALTREIMQELVLDIWRETKKMVFFITHSVDEAIFMATRLVVMSPRPGRIIKSYNLDFNQRFFKTRDARRVKSLPEFIEVRQEVLDIIHGDEIRIDQG